ncbi:hypothetical protein C8J35_10759 [Rhizobium sp. PP-F2F-G38]|uniref:Uncharacterized protein n=1 Tax=Ferranicluibacter rubi TaxID=2715133 RepID=A0AA43ZF79_9HYPH|nr:hypothetical protein [Ferranicluibacter rubi]PYE32472.1 hypothetical protein C8J37_10759 [Rhizobium sp. PP-WC-1G-195]PYE95900.1 hypothetical protein C8J35_10759 [Rhizobium sp. PP-F2F-G38]TCP88494.1 hypothetical protein C8J31_103347 [Rhizobium sp. PP-CC-2G-626]TCQ22840.1 hypothetical protein C8J33_10559 [Rhizobium sp. PP-CC-3G-465]
MSRRSLAPKAVILLGMATLLWGCSTPQPATDVSPRPASSSQALLDHQRKQATRAREGGYERLYRPRVCRSNIGVCPR